MEIKEKTVVNSPKKRKSCSLSPTSKSDEAREKPKRRQALVPKSIAHYAAEQVGVEYNMMHSFSLSCTNGKTAVDASKEAVLVDSGRTDEEEVDEKKVEEVYVDHVASAVESGSDDSEDDEKR